MLRQNPLPATEFGGSPNHQKPVRNASRRDCERRIPGGILVHSGNTIAPRAARHGVLASPLTKMCGPRLTIRRTHTPGWASAVSLESGTREGRVKRRHVIGVLGCEIVGS